MLVLTENIFEKPNNSKSSRNEVIFKSNNSQLKVIANRITPYCREISKNKNILIRTRKYISNTDKIKYKSSNSRKNIGNSLLEKKLKTSSAKKKKDSCQLEILSKGKKKKNQVTAYRVNYNIIFKNYYLKNIKDRTNLFLLNLKGKKQKKIQKKEKSKKDILNAKKIPLGNLKDICGDNIDNLHKLSNIPQNKVKNILDLDNKDIIKNRQLYDKKIGKLYFVGKPQNNAILDIPFNNNDKLFKPYAKTHMQNIPIFNNYYKRELISNSLIDSIIILSNKLNRTNERTNDFNYENDKSEKNMLHYVNKIVHDNYAYRDFSINVKKDEIKKLDCKEKKNDNVPNFCFRKFSKNIECKNKNSHKNKCNNYNICYDSDYIINYNKIFMDYYNYNENKCVYEKKQRNEYSLNSLIYSNCYSDNYFSEKKRKKKRCEFHQICKSFKHINSNKQGEKEFPLTNKGNKNINFKSILDNQKINKNYSKELYAFKQINNINRNFISKKQKSTETEIDNSNTFYTFSDFNHINTKSSCINMYNKVKCIDKNENNELCKIDILNYYSKINSANSLHYAKNNSTICVDQNKYTSTKKIDTEEKLKENYNLKGNNFQEKIYTEEYSLNKKNNINKNSLDNENIENNSELVANKVTELRSLTSSVNSISSADLLKTPIESNIENHNFNSFTNFISEGIKTLCIFKSKHKKERLTNKTSLIVDFRNSHSNDINLITHNKRFNNLLFNKDIKMNNNDPDFLVDECLMKCLKDSSSNFRTNEDYERYCNEDKILNPDYIPLESKKLGENFLKNQKDLFSSYTNNNFPYEPNINNAECGNSCFKNDKNYSLFNDSNKNYFNNMSINIFNNKEYVKDKNNYNNNAYNKNYINSISKEYYLKKSNDHIKDKFIKYYEKYSNKDNDEYEAKKLNYTDCYDFKNSLLNELSRDDSFCSDNDIKNDDSETSFLKDSMNSFDNLESTEKKYEEILRDFNGKIPLLHKVLKPLPPKNRSNNFDICLYLLQKHGGDLNNEENICILRDKEMIEHSAIYDTKKNCIKSNITNVTNIKLYHPKWYNKKKIIERMKEQSCYNPFTIFGSAPSLLDFDEVFDKDVYNKFVSRNSRKSHSLLRILAKQKVINNLSDKISDKEWPQVHAYLKKRWNKETNLELNWACDPLLYEELEWYLSTNNEYLNMTDKVADIDVCYCPTLNPSSYYAWNDSRVIYTNLCYNKSKEEIDPNNSTKGNCVINNNMELKNNDKQVSIRKRASGCEHLMFQQNIMKQKNLSKKKKKLLKKKKKMLKEKKKLFNYNYNGGTYNEVVENSKNNYNNIYFQVNKNDYVSDQCINELKNKDNNNNSYYPNIFLTKNKKSVYLNKNNGDNVIPIMPVNTSIYRHNMDNKYNYKNTANDYIKNKDNTIKFFASPKKTKKNNSVQKSLNNSECFYFFNNSMINSDNIYNNNFDSFDSKNSMDCNNYNTTHYNKNISNENIIRNKNEMDTQKDYINNKLILEKNDQNICGDLETNKNNFSMNNRYEMQNSKKTNVIKKTNNMSYIMNSDNNYEDQNNFNIKSSDDFTQSFHNRNKNCYRDDNNNDNKNINNNSAKINIFNNVEIDNEKKNNKISNDNKSDNSDYDKDNKNNDKNNNDNNDDDKNSFNNNNGNNNYNNKIRSNNNNNSNSSSNNNSNINKFNNNSNNNDNNHGKERLYKKKFIDKNYYDLDQMKLISDDFNNLQTDETSNYHQLEKNKNFQNKLSDPNFSEKSEDKKKFNIKELKEKYINICKNQNANDNYHKTFTYSYETAFNNKYINSINEIGVKYFKNKNSLNSIKMENNNVNENIVSKSDKNNKIMKNLGNISNDNILKLTQKNIDRKDILEKKIRSNISLYSKNNDTDIFLSTLNSKRLSNSNISVNENRKIRRYTNQICLESDNISIEQSENTKGESNKKGSNETLSSRTSETSMSSAFKMATSVFKKLF